MLKKRNAPLALLFAALVTVMCRCDATPDINREFEQTQGDPVYCRAQDYMFEYGDFSGWETKCSLKCPDGSVQFIMITGPKVPSIIKTEDYCGTASALPIPTATVAPTATEPGPEPATSAPLLSGDVTACSMKDGFINFKLVDADPGFSGSDVYLTINGTQVSCTVAGDNKDVLSCALPPGVTFPAQIHAAVGDASTDDFVHNGEGCTTQNGAPGGGGGEGAPGQPPTPCLGDNCT
jgi:hypothetical protein